MWTIPFYTPYRCLAVIALSMLAMGARAATAADAGGDVSVVAAKCELATDPMGVDGPQPRLFWQIQSESRGQRQTAYQILVASNAQTLSHDQGDLWDSGKVAGDQTTYVRYAGKALSSSQAVFWKVRAWDANNLPTAWSKPATWTMGLLSPGDWKGRWIAAATPAQSILLRHEFVVRPDLRRATVYVSGLGQYELNLNGAKVGHDLLTPGWTNYNKTVLYDTYDVTAALHAGPNAAGLTLGNGMYKVERPAGRFAKFVGSFGEQKAILHLRLDYADGSTDVVGTDTSWKTHAGPITFSSIYGGEDVDARLAHPGWDKPGFDDRDWTAAIDAGPADATLHGLTHAANPIHEIESHKPVKSQTFADGSIVYDFGQNASFVPRIRISGPAGSTVRLTPAEVVTPAGQIYRGTTGGPNRGSSYWQYTKATDQPETWFPQFFYTGGRYVHAAFFAPGEAFPDVSTTGVYPPAPDAVPTTLSANRPAMDSIEAVVIHSTAEPAGTFTSSSDLLNKIHDLIRWAQRSNLVSIITDCPHRERLGWLEQLNMSGPSLRYEWNLARLLAKIENDMGEAQDDSGLVPNIAPEYTRFKGTFRAAAEWGSSFIAVPWQQYLFDGDTDLLAEHFDAMKRYVDYLSAKADSEGIVEEGLGDWFDVGPQKPGKSQHTPPPITATAFYYESTATLAHIAEVLKRPEAKELAAKAEVIRANYLKKFYHADTGTFATNSQAANGIALAMGIARPGQRAKALDALVQDLQANEYGPIAADIGFRYVIRALADADRNDVVYHVITQDAKPGYARQVEQGETTLTESWDAGKTTSHNHFMLGHADEWFYHDVAGIVPDPAGPGFSKVLIRPNPVGDLKWVEATHTSLHGKISVRWERNGHRFKLLLKIPANTTATVALPSRDDSVTEDGRPVAHSVGVVAFPRSDGRANFSVQSGSYVFESNW